MDTTSRDSALFIIAFTCILGLVVEGRALLVPLVFALLLWAVMNAMTAYLMRLRLPAWAAWTGTFALSTLALYFFFLVASNEAAGIAVEGPALATKFETLLQKMLAPLKLGVNLKDMFSTADMTGYLGDVASSLGTSLMIVIQIVVYVGFLLAQQDQLVVKFADMQRDHVKRNEGIAVLQTIAHQVQSYLGVCTVLSAIMAAVTYGLLYFMGVQFAGFWALILFVLTYIPTVGAVGVIFPALMAFIQFGTLWPALVIFVVLAVAHFVLLNVVETLVLGQSLNLSPFVIIIALTFWGLAWGIPGLFLAVPVTGAVAIICGHINGLKWINTLCAAPSARLQRRLKHHHKAQQQHLHEQQHTHQHAHEHHPEHHHPS
jgi:predicted PurR-regulated permease PerM